MPKVLIIEDDAVLRDFLESSLTQDGFEVRTADSLAAVQHDGYDAVLAEIERPFSLDRFENRLQLMGLTDTSKRG